MSSGAPKMSTAEKDRLTGAWEYAADSELTHTVRMRIVFYPSHARGVWVVCADAYTSPPGELPQRVARMQKQYPNGDQQTLSGLLLEMSVKLSKMLDESARDGGASDGHSLAVGE